MQGWERRPMKAEPAKQPKEAPFLRATPYIHWWHHFERPAWLPDDRDDKSGPRQQFSVPGIDFFIRGSRDVFRPTIQQLTLGFQGFDVLQGAEALVDTPFSADDQIVQQAASFDAIGTTIRGAEGVGSTVEGLAAQQIDLIALPVHAKDPANADAPALMKSGTDMAGIGDMPEGTVIVGVIDDAIAIGHPRFQRIAEDGTRESRILVAWQQDGVFAPGPPYGREVLKAEIDAALRDPALDPAHAPEAFNRHLFPNPQTGPTTMSAISRTLMSRAGHGTHVADLACGEDPAVASPSRDLVRMITVGLPHRSSVGMSGTFLELYVVHAMRRIVEWADAIWQAKHPDKPDGGYPVVINLSYGQQAGPKTGTSLIEQEFLLLQERRKHRAGLELVMPIGNDNLTRSNARWMLRPSTQELPIPWRVLPQDQSSNFVEVWADMAEADLEGRIMPLDLKVVPPRTEPEEVDWIEPNSASDPGAYCFYRPPGSEGTPLEGDLWRVYMQRVAVPDVTQEGIAAVIAAETNGAADPVPPLLYRQRYVIAARPTLDQAAPDRVAPAGCWRIYLRWSSQMKEILPEQGQEIYMNVQVDQDMDATSRAHYRSYFDNARYRTHQPSGRALDSWAYATPELGLALEGDPNLDPPYLYGAVHRKGTHNSLANHERVIAVAGYRLSDGRPAAYSGTSMPEARVPEATRGFMRIIPTAAFPTDMSPSLPGLRAAGNRAGAQVRLQGTSFAAPQATRWLVAHLLQGGGAAALPAELVEAARQAEGTGRAYRVPYPGKVGWGRMPSPRPEIFR